MNPRNRSRELLVRLGRLRRAAAFAVAAMGLIATTVTPTRADPRQNDAVLRVPVDKAEVVALDGAASVVLVANPQIADVVLERNRLLFVLGRRPGETRLYVYDGNGQTLLQRDIVVVPPRERTVTVIRTTSPTHYSCDTRCVALGESAAAVGVEPVAGMPSSAAPQPATTPAP